MVLGLLGNRSLLQHLATPTLPPSTLVRNQIFHEYLVLVEDYELTESAHTLSLFGDQAVVASPVHARCKCAPLVAGEELWCGAAAYSCRRHWVDVARAAVLRAR
jgi:hypothetical protein